MRMLPLAKYHRSMSRKATEAVWGFPLGGSSPVPRGKAVWDCAEQAEPRAAFAAPAA